MSRFMWHKISFQNGVCYKNGMVIDTTTKTSVADTTYNGRSIVNPYVKVSKKKLRKNGHTRKSLFALQKEFMMKYGAGL